MQDSELEQILWQALDTERGLQIEVSDAETFKRRFYAVRKKARNRGIVEFDMLSCTTSPTDPMRKVWLVKRERHNGKGTGEGNDPAGEGTEGTTQ